METNSVRMAPVTLTQAAERALLSRMGGVDGDVQGIRLVVKATGCSGHSYGMERVASGDSVAGDDVFSCANGAVLFIPKIHSWMLFGIQIDYGVDELGNEKFLFVNPNETGRCGCGESFKV